jgi:hypothetical protein
MQPLQTVTEDGGSTVMRWFRDNPGKGAWLALTALVINLGLSFGHVHLIDGRHTDGGLASLIASATSQDDKTQGHHDDGLADDLCPICAAVAAMASPLAAPPPTPPTEFVGVPLDRTIEPVIAIADRPAPAFQSRGPPIS